MKTEPTEAYEAIEYYEANNINIDAFRAKKLCDVAFYEGQSSPKIKQLEWKRDCGGIWFTKSVSFEFGAMIQETKKGTFRLSYNWDTYFTPYDSLDEAKAAAQADFEKRVMECLDL